METTYLDSQVSDLAWCLSCGLRAGYNLREVFEQLAKLAPEPSASACRQMAEALEQGQDILLALEDWKRENPSIALARLANAIAQSQQTDGNLADMLELLEQELLQASGSDPAFYPMMREEAVQLGAKIPARAQQA